MIAKKSLGQNFIKDKNTILKIIKTTGISNQDTVIEIGPGLGALTIELDKVAKKVIAIEIDERCIKELLKLNLKVTTVIKQDFLKINELEISRWGENLKLAANLPYYIATPIIIKVLLTCPNVKELTVMLQKEVAQRITATPQTKQFGSLSVICQTLAEVKFEYLVSKNIFMPKPNVDSAILTISRRETKNIDIINFDKFLKEAFRQKRKTLVNNLHDELNNFSKDTIQEILVQANLTPNCRAEELTPKKLYEIFEIVKKHKS